MFLGFQNNFVRLEDGFVARLLGNMSTSVFAIFFSVFLVLKHYFLEFLGFLYAVDEVASYWIWRVSIQFLCLLLCNLHWVLWCWFCLDDFELLFSPSQFLQVVFVSMSQSAVLNLQAYRVAHNFQHCTHWCFG